MRDRLESLALVLLLVLSMVLARQLWFQPTIEFSKKDEETRVLSEAHLLDKIIVPSKTLVNFRNGSHTVSYENTRYGLWEDAKPHLEALFAAPTLTLEEITLEEYLEKTNQISVQFSFSVPLNTLILPEVWDVDVKNDIALKIPQMEGVLIELIDVNPKFIMLSQGKVYRVSGVEKDTRGLQEKIDDIESQGNYTYYYSMKESRGVMSPVFLPYEMDSYMPKLYVSSSYSYMASYERGRVAQRVLKKDVDQIRQITQKEGSYLYVSGQKVLRFDQEGTVSYTEPISHHKKDRNLYRSLEAGVDFMYRLHGGSEPFYLSDIRPIVKDGTEGYQFNLRYLVRGIPVVLADRGRDSYIEMEVYDEQVARYVELGREETSVYTSSLLESRLIMPSFDVLDQNVELLKRIYLGQHPGIPADQIDSAAILQAIDNITLAYLDKNIKNLDQELNAVWAVQMGQKTLCFDAFTGKVLYER